MCLLDATCMHVLHQSTPDREDQSRDPADGLEIGSHVLSGVQTYKHYFDEQIHDQAKVSRLRLVYAVPHVAAREHCSAEEEWVVRVCLRRFVFNLTTDGNSEILNLQFLLAIYLNKPEEEQRFS